jgi:hypothetical protein
VSGSDYESGPAERTVQRQLRMIPKVLTEHIRLHGDRRDIILQIGLSAIAIAASVQDEVPLVLERPLGDEFPPDHVVSGRVVLRERGAAIE